MNQKTVYQIDLAGHYIGSTVADASPLEPGVWLLPSGTIEEAPPAEWPDGLWPRWNGAAWQLITRPTTAGPDTAKEDALAKIREFLAANPDVAGYLGAL